MKIQVLLKYTKMQLRICVVLQIRVGAIQRVLQGPGPFLITFRPNTSLAFQVDGEFFNARALSSVSVQRVASYGMLKYEGEEN